MADGSICKYNEYFDPYTGNCDPCKPICDVADCTQLCPKFSTITTTTTITDTPAGEYNTYIILLICLLLVSVIVVTAIMIVLYKRCRPITCTCTRHQYKTPENQTQAIQATDDLLLSITLHDSV